MIAMGSGRVLLEPRFADVEATSVRISNQDDEFRGFFDLDGKGLCDIATGKWLIYDREIDTDELSLSVIALSNIPSTR